MFSLICVWINGWENNREAGDFRCYHAHYDVIVMKYMFKFDSMSITPPNKANLTDLMAATGLVILLIIEFKSSIFQGVWPSNLMDDLAKQYGTCSMLCEALWIISKPAVNSNWSYSPEMLNPAYFFAQCELEIWWMTLNNNRAPLLCYFNLCVWSHSHWSIQTGVTVWKCPIRDFFLFRATLKFYGWPWKIIGHLFYAPLSFVHHFIATDEFKLELQSRNSQFGSKSEIFCPVWLWNLMDDLEKQ